MNSFLDDYTTRVERGDLTYDDAQMGAVKEFDRIQSELEEKQTRWFRKAKPQKGLYLWGGVGRGKSMLMDMFVDRIDLPKRRVHFHAFMQEIHGLMHDARAANARDAIQPVAQAMAKDLRLLAFDEMQITDITDAMIVGRLFEALFQLGVVVITTSNRVPSDLYKDGLNRQLFLPFIDLLTDHMVVHELASPTDYRLEKLAGNKRYITPLGKDATDEVTRIWSSLIGDATPKPLELVVKKRKLILPQYHNGVARADFQDICAKPLGPSDFLALSDHLRVLILENIPTLGPDNFNEAKRFVTLVDNLYEAKTGFIVSAAAPPEKLYPKGRGSFEFERTASRLREMQSDDWGS